MSKIQQNAEQKRQAIVLAAKGLFLDQGYGVTSMDTIAQAAGVTKQTVYRYYPSKEALFAAVMQEVRQSNSAPYQFSSDPLGDELTRYGIQLLAFHLRPEALGLYRLMLTEGSRNPDLFKTFQNTGPRSFLEPLSRFLNNRCRTLDDPDFAAGMFCNMILSPRNNMLIGQSSGMQTKQQHRHVKQVVDFILPSISSEQDTST